MSKNKDDVHVGDWNIDEFYYKYLGKTHRRFYWRWWMHTKWFFQDLKGKIPSRNKEVRHFLHLDIQQLKHHKQFGFYTRKLRYVDKSGTLLERKFKIWAGYSTIELMEMPGFGPSVVKGPKGPRTFKVAVKMSNSYHWFGIRRTKNWAIPTYNVF